MCFCMKHLFFVCLAAACAITASAQGFKWSAQTQPVQNFEGELSFGFTRPLSGFNDGKRVWGPSYSMELRYNLHDLPLDIGFNINSSMACYEFNVFNDDYYYDGTTDIHKLEQDNMTMSIAVVTDWNFRQGRRTNPFVGLGIGTAATDVSYDSPFGDSRTSKWSPVFMPRVGVELFCHLRFTLSANITRSGYHTLQFSIGGVIGGRPKKAKDAATN